MDFGKIIVVMGGTSTEAEVSRKTGNAILKALLAKGYDAEGMELVPETFAESIQKSGCKVVFNAVHGKYGEDGSLQGTLDMLGIPYTGSGVLASAITMDKIATKRIFLAEGISTPDFLVCYRNDMSDAVLASIREKFSFPVVIKAPSQGSSIGVHIVECEEELASAMEEAFSYSNEILVEKFIRGRELTVAVWGTEEVEAFPVIEITTLSGRYDYASKYTKGASTHIVPAKISDQKTKEIQELAQRAFRACGCRGIARVDVMLDEKDLPYAIEVNSVPGMTENSLVPDAARAVGMKFEDLCEKLLEMANTL